MKKVLTIVIAAIVVLTGAFAIYRFNFMKKLPVNASQEDQVLAILEQNDCYACHSSKAAQPFYINYPIIGSQLKKDMSRASRYIDLANVDVKSINEADLAKIEQAMLTGSMPLMKYRMVHWGKGFNKSEKSVIASWVMTKRASQFATGLASAENANCPLQPLTETVAVDSSKLALGTMLYFDTRISADNTVSCATCHPLEKGGVDGLRTSQGIHQMMGGINAPTVYNAVFNCKQFWNGRANTLAEQAAGPPVNPKEMGDQTWDAIVARLREDKALVATFAALYPGTGLTEETVTDAIAEFEKTLITPNAPIDLYLKGDANALTADQVKGLHLFVSSDCATCHVGQGLGGQSFEYLGIAEDYHKARLVEHPEIEYNSDDDGLFGFTNNKLDLHKYKVPMLRNVALTAPYLHDGTALTLEDAITAMMRFQLGETASKEDIHYMVEFLNSLTGSHAYMHQLPAAANKKDALAKE